MAQHQLLSLESIQHLVSSLEQLLARPSGYNNDAYKRQFHALSRKLLGQLASRLNLREGTYEIRYNRAGPAILGNVTLHGEDIYISFSDLVKSLGVLFRTCQGRKDYSGGRNNWAKLESLHDFDDFVESVKTLKTQGNVLQ